ncbi:MAG: ATP-binding protein [Spongiibacteraceae bacterium]
MSNNVLSFTASAANLSRLAAIRLIFIATVTLALLYLSHQSEEAVRPIHIVILTVLALVNAATYWRLRQSWPVTDLEYFCQLLLGVIIITILLYNSGGATNPLVSYYLVPITISAAVLPWRFTWVIAGLSLIAYSVMLFSYRPLIGVDDMSDHGHGNSAISLHIIGMWFTFALSTSLITYFVVKMAAALRQQEAERVAEREDKLLNEQILAVATLAAGTAHELGTPLATMMVLIGELEQDQQDQPQLVSDLALLKNQVISCKKILQGLVSTAEAHSHGQQSMVALDDFMQQILNRWQILRPEAQLQFEANTDSRQAKLMIDPTLEQAICNLLNNAADASPEKIDVSLSCDHNTATINIRDHGEGIPEHMSQQMGQPFITTKGKGLGLGLFLTHATINRYNGKIELFNHPEGGTIATVQLPLNTNTLTHPGTDSK